MYRSKEASSSSWGKINVKPKIKSIPSSAAELVSQDFENIKIVTMCESIDNLLGGGFDCGKLIEIFGAAGVGKTQLCFQACASVQLPLCIGGLNGQAIYIDTEGSFSTKRLIQMARYMLQHCHKLFCQFNLNDTQKEALSKLTELDLLKSIFYYRCTDQDQLLALTYRLHKFCENNSRIRLIVVDSIAFHFRYDCEDIPRRNRILTVIGHNLSRIANSFGISVLLTNQMTTKFINDVGYATAALGESWGHICPIRIQIESDSMGNQNSICGNNLKRRFSLLKHPAQPVNNCLFLITIGGIRDVVD